MKSYSELEIFSERELGLLRWSTVLVERCVEAEPELRCHELARAVGRIVNLRHQDGFYGWVNHTWLWTADMPDDWHPPNILDVYAVGSLPQVRLVDMQHSGLGHAQIYRRDKERTDIDEQLVERLIIGARAAMLEHGGL